MAKTISFHFEKGNRNHAGFAQLFLEAEREKAGYTAKGKATTYLTHKEEKSHDY